MLGTKSLALQLVIRTLILSGDKFLPSVNRVLAKASFASEDVCQEKCKLRQDVEHEWRWISDQHDWWKDWCRGGDGSLSVCFGAFCGAFASFGDTVLLCRHSRTSNVFFRGEK